MSFVALVVLDLALIVGAACGGGEEEERGVIESKYGIGLLLSGPPPAPYTPVVLKWQVFHMLELPPCASSTGLEVSLRRLFQNGVIQR